MSSDAPVRVVNDRQTIFLNGPTDIVRYDQPLFFTLFGPNLISDGPTNGLSIKSLKVDPGYQCVRFNQN